MNAILMFICLTRFTFFRSAKNDFTFAFADKVLYLFTVVNTFIIWLIRCHLSRRKTEKLSRFLKSFSNCELFLSWVWVRENILMQSVCEVVVVAMFECVYISGIAVSLVLRTLCDLWLIQNGTQIEAAIITADVQKLRSNISMWMWFITTIRILC